MTRTITRNMMTFILLSIILFAVAKCPGPIGGPEYGPSEEFSVHHIKP